MSDIIRLKQDIQTCIAKNIQTLDTYYNLLFCDKNNIDLVQSLGGFNILKIFPDNGKMRFVGEIATDLDFSEEQLQHIRQHVWKKDMLETINQMAQAKKTPQQKHNEKIFAELMLDNILDNMQNEKEITYRQATEFDRRLLYIIQKRISEIGLDLKYEEYKEQLLLATNIDKITLNKHQLREIENLVRKLNFFLIAPIYDEIGEKCISIRIAMGIDLKEEIVAQ